jgi:PAS domain S-box-containing protein
MKAQRYYFLYILFLCCSFIPTAHAQLLEGLPHIDLYTSDEYNADRNIWGVVEDFRGVSYFGSNQGLLEFDGLRWQLHELPSRTRLRSMVFGDDQRLYVGAIGEIGYFDYDERGRWQYTSLLPLIPEGQRRFTEVWNVYKTKYGIAFCTFTAIYLYQNNRIQVCLPSEGSTFHIAHTVREELYVREVGKGLLKYHQGQMMLMADGEKMADVRLYGWVGLPDNSFLAFTREDGLMRYKNGQFEPWNPPVADFINKAQVYKTEVLRDGTIAVATLTQGLAIINTQGELVSLFNRNRGLPDNTIYKVYENTEGNLWLCLSNGIAFVERNTAFYTIDERLGLEGDAQLTIQYQGRQYLATSRALMQATPLGADDWLKGKVAPFTPVPNTTNFILSLAVAQDRLLVGHINGLYELDANNKVRDVSRKRIEFLANTKDPEVVLAGTTNGIAVLRWKNKRWEDEGILKGFDFEAVSASTQMIEQRRGIWWVADPVHGLSKIELNEDYSRILKQARYDQTKGLPLQLHNYPALIGREVWVGSGKGLYRYNPQKDIFEPHTALQQVLGAYGKKATTFIHQDGKGVIWLVCEGRVIQLYPQKDGTYQLDDRKFRRLQKVRALHFNPDGTLLIIHDNRLTYYQPKHQTKRNTPFKAYLRLVQEDASDNDSIFSMGIYREKNKKLSTQQPRTEVFKLPFALNSLRFAFGSNAGAQPKQTLYSYLLEGFEDHWSPWNSKFEKEYTNLRPGKYTFRVRAQNAAGLVSQEARYQFVILPPWYRTWWAYLLYVVGGSGVIFAIVWLNIYRIRLQRKALERKVEEKTLELQEQNERLRAQEEELRQNMEELIATQEEMARTQGELFGQLTALENSNIIYAEIDPVGTVLKVNQSFMRFFEYDWQEVLTLDHRQLLPEAYANDEAYRTDWERILNGEYLSGTYKRYDKQGNLKWIDAIYSPVRDAQGQVIKVLNIGFDITRVQELLAESEAQNTILQAQESELRHALEEAIALQSELQKKTAIFENSRDAIWLLEGAQIINCNEAAVALFEGKHKVDVIGHAMTKFLPEQQQNGKSSAELINRRIQKAIEKGTNFFEWQHKTLQGRVFYAEVMMSYFEFENKKLLAATIRDISERKLQEEEIQRQNELILEQKVAIEAALQEQQEQNERLRAQEEEMRQNVEELIAIQEQMQATQLELLGQMSAIDSSSVLKAEYALDGELIAANSAFIQRFALPEDWQEQSTFYHKMFIPSRYADSYEYDFFWDNLREGATYPGEFKRYGLDKKRFWINTVYSPVTNAEGKVYKVIELAFDVTESKQLTEELRYQAQILREQEEQMRQNMEELVATQEAMEQKQIELEKTSEEVARKNQKLEANETVLRKAYEKMRSQEEQLRLSYEALKSQEEELRQNMEELVSTQDALKQQKETLEVKNKLITASIQYALNIQQAILPGEEVLRQYFKNCFVIFRPKDIVSGDFYWVSRKKDCYIVAVVDCTGHGVPGAFMSMIGNSLLNEIVNNDGHISPSTILEKLHLGIRQRLKQENTDNHDGMDVAICSVRHVSEADFEVTFAGAKRPLYYLPQGHTELQVLQGERKAIGGWQHEIERRFHNQTITLTTGSLIYLCTDGIADNPNARRKKFGEIPLRQLLQELATEPLQTQQAKIIEAIVNHQGRAEQRDDMTLVAIQL